jgi:hypothetical protein
MPPAKDKPDRRSPLAKARDDWMESDDGKKCLETSILFKTSDRRYLLKYRLEMAFIAGANCKK